MSSNRATVAHRLAVAVVTVVMLLGKTGLAAAQSAEEVATGDYSVPFGLGAGKVFRSGRAVLNAFLEPQRTVLHDAWAAGSRTRSAF